MKKVLILFFSIVVVAILFIMMGNRGVRAPFIEPSQSTITSTPSPSSRQITVFLQEENKSGQSGTATFIEENGKVVVRINITASRVSQPAHIHSGSCPGVGGVEIPLTALIDGKSETTVSGSLASLLAKTPLAVNVHKSNTQLQMYVACGEINPQKEASDPD